VFDIGDGPQAVLSVNKNSTHQVLSPGDMIGQYKLVGVNTVEIALEWKGQVFHKSIEELTDHSESVVQASAVAAANAAAAAPALPPVMSEKGPGDATPFGVKTCQPNDSTPDGTVVDGYRKSSHPTPFGNACSWDPVGR
jgi:hypothetical protein